MKHFCLLYLVKYNRQLLHCIFGEICLYFLRELIEVFGNACDIFCLGPELTALSTPILFLFSCRIRRLPRLCFPRISRRCFPLFNVSGGTFMTGSVYSLFPQSSVIIKHRLLQKCCKNKKDSKYMNLFICPLRHLLFS